MASNKSKATEAPKVEDWEHDFGGEDITQAEIGGWYNVELAKLKDEVCMGQFVGVKETTTDTGKSLNLLVRIDRPLHAVSGDPKSRPGTTIKIGNDDLENVVELPPGEVVAVGMRYAFDPFLDYVDTKGHVAFKPDQKVKLKGGRTMWKFKMRVKGKKGPRPKLSSQPTPGENDDIPF